MGKRPPLTLLLLSTLLALAAAAWVVGPLVARRTALLADAAPGAVLDAEARKRVALAALQELEYDFLAGKLDGSDYKTQRDVLSAEALAAIRNADAVQTTWQGSSTSGVRLRPSVDEALAAAAGRHRCGFVNPAGSRFCSGCGTRLR